ncbi:DUF5067 domain-containing protein [Enterococcus wangshanyuanii]|uniref:DUF5067 domain-containing protein n=1 Tax=Enterococcus wangshanyuanii TaxID=2005703 RepID=A0ABQ1NR71_9ENTE|nr:DUF5067 domain-containing protein [Enterococcus wangshanyuanii]GGC83426.1 hypothetical protein GCM10011573_11310 [Enterococcus wangshanyuanii]
MKNKWLLTFFLSLELLSITACTTTINRTQYDEKPKVMQNSSTVQEQLYGELSNLVSFPKQIKRSDLFNQKISFVVRAQGEPYQMNSKDTTLNGVWYIPVFLMRNQKIPIYLDLSNIKKEQWPKDGEILKVDGLPIGYLYTSYKNERLDLLDIQAQTIQKVVHSKKKVTTKQIIETQMYKIEFTGTDHFLDSFNEANMIVYYNFKNKKQHAAISPLKTYFQFSQNDEVLEPTFIPWDNELLDPKAINRDSLESGEEMLYYEVYKLKNEETPLIVRTFDDEYALLNELEMSIKKITENQ